MSQRLLHAMSRQRKYHLRHMRAGLCYDCSRPVSSGTLFCDLYLMQGRVVMNHKYVLDGQLQVFLLSLATTSRLCRSVRTRNASSFRGFSLSHSLIR
jgi:hypothetical protein